MIAFHKEAFRTGKATLALTCLRGVYRALKQLGIPCYRIKPAEPVTRNILGRIQERVNFLYVKKSSNCGCWRTCLVHANRAEGNCLFV